MAEKAARPRRRSRAYCPQKAMNCLILQGKRFATDQVAIGKDIDTISSRREVFGYIPIHCYG